MSTARHLEKEAIIVSGKDGGHLGVLVQQIIVNEARHERIHEKQRKIIAII
jgi:hypothetical protein